MRRSTHDRARVNASQRRRPALEVLEARTVLSTFTVTNLFDSGPGSLRAAVAAANTAPGVDVIKFTGRLEGTITLASELSITDDLRIDGPNANKLTVSGGNTTRVFHVSGSTTDLAIEDLTIANGRASVPGGNAFGGGLLNEGASVSLSYAVLANNQAVGSTAGGGAVANLGGYFTADHTDFLGNASHNAVGQIAFAGAVYNDQGASVEIGHGTFSGNMAVGGNAPGGAVGAVGGNAHGGAVGGFDGSKVTLAYCSFDRNQAQGDPGDPNGEGFGGGFGGAVAAQRDGLIASATPTVTITHCSFTRNKALVRAATNGADVGFEGAGGAIDLEDGSMVTVDYSTFDGNQALGGAGGDGSAGSDGGVGGDSFGGAIASASATLIVSHCQFTGNEVHGGNGGKGGAGKSGGDGGVGIGGAISASVLFSPGAPVPPTTQIDHCDFVGNHATGGASGAGGSGGNGGFGGRGDGGAINNIFGIMTVSNSSVVQNQAQGGAGGALGAAPAPSAALAAPPGPAASPTSEAGPPPSPAR